MDGGRWCPVCGAEYLPRVDICKDCRAPLEDAPPPAPDHATVTYDLADWDDTQRRAMELLLTGAGVSFGWEAITDLVVPQTAERVVDELIEDLDHRPAATQPEESLAPAGRVDALRTDDDLATIGQRAIARLIDGLLTVLPSSVIFVMTIRRMSGTNLPAMPFGLRILGLAVPFAYEVALIALWGRTLGKRLVGIRVEGPDGQLPGWGRSLRRWLLPFALGIVPYIGWLLATAAVLRAAFVPDRRGFHDLAAGTTVRQGEN